MSQICVREVACIIPVARTYFNEIFYNIRRHITSKRKNHAAYKLIISFNMYFCLNNVLSFSTFIHHVEKTNILILKSTVFVKIVHMIYANFHLLDMLISHNYRVHVSIFVFRRFLGRSYKIKVIVVNRQSQVPKISSDFL